MVSMVSMVSTVSIKLQPFIEDWGQIIYSFLVFLV